MSARTLLLAAALAAPSGGLAAQAPLFRAEEPLAVTLRTDLRTLLRRRDDSTTWRPATLAWSDSAGTHAVPVALRQRGHFRRLRCDLPPLRLRFDADSVRGTPWAHTRHPKLVTHCMDRDEYEQYVLQEYAIYRLWGLLAPAGFATRLLRVTYEDESGGRRPVTRYGIMVEDPARMADRLGGSLLDVMSVRMSELRGSDVATLGVFQYFIGNTDWSVPGLHNIQLLRTSDTVVAIPFDFDWTGAVDARYAYPDPRLHVHSVRDRVYRGLCQDSAALGPVLDRLVALRDTIGALYRAIPGLDPGGANRTLGYFGDFYTEIRDRRWFMREVVQPSCMRT